VEKYGHTELTTMSPEDNYDAEIILESLIISGTHIDKSLSQLSFNYMSAGYGSISEVFIQSVPNILIDTYGNGLSFKNFCENNYSTTVYKNILFPASASNREILDSIIKDYRVVLNPVLYGFDEGMVDKISTEFLIVDLLDPDSWYHLDPVVTYFFNNSENRVNANAEYNPLRRFYPEDKALSLFNSTLIVKNKTSEDIFKVAPINPGKALAPKIEVSESLGSVVISDQSASDIRTTFIETTLTEKDFKKSLDAELSLYQKRLMIKQLILTGAPYETFRLGRKFPKEVLQEDALIIGGDVIFEPIPNNADPADIFTPIRDKANPFKCSGSVFLLSGY